jgi:hypothetical protein
MHQLSDRGDKPATTSFKIFFIPAAFIARPGNDSVSER